MNRLTRRPRSTARAQGGFTIIELLISLAISSLLVGMVFAIVLRMSVSYRTQQQVAEVQQVLSSALALVRQDAKAAGYGMPNGFVYAARATDLPATTELTYEPPIQIINGSNTSPSNLPDELRFFWADASKIARVEITAPGGFLSHDAGFLSNDGEQLITLSVDDPSDFVDDDYIVVTSYRLENRSVPSNPGETQIAAYRSCVARIASVVPGTPGSLNLDVAPPWGNTNQSQCSHVRAQHIGDGTAATTMVYGFQGRGYRIDASRSVLQRAPRGGLDGVWEDIGIGFTDLQVSARYYEEWSGTATATTDVDGDVDPAYDWYVNTTGLPTALPWMLPSGDGNRFGPFEQPIDAVITFVVRTQATVEGIGTGATPDLEEKQLGDHPSETLTGAHIYRHATARVDFRNMGVGR